MICLPHMAHIPFLYAQPVCVRVCVCVCVCVCVHVCEKHKTLVNKTVNTHCHKLKTGYHYTSVNNCTTVHLLRDRKIGIILLLMTVRRYRYRNFYFTVVLRANVKLAH